MFFCWFVLNTGYLYRLYQLALCCCGQHIWQDNLGKKHLFQLMVSEVLSIISCLHVFGQKHHVMEDNCVHRRRQTTENRTGSSQDPFSLSSFSQPLLICFLNHPNRHRMSMLLHFTQVQNDSSLCFYFCFLSIIDVEYLFIYLLAIFMSFCFFKVFLNSFLNWVKTKVLNK